MYKSEIITRQVAFYIYNFVQVETNSVKAKGL